MLIIIWSVQNGWTALHKASHQGHCGVVRMLLEAKTDVNKKTNVSHSACLYDSVAFVHNHGNCISGCLLKFLVSLHH